MDVVLRMCQMSFRMKSTCLILKCTLIQIRLFLYSRLYSHSELLELQKRKKNHLLYDLLINTYECD